jgi:hypothetical protein
LDGSPSTFLLPTGEGEATIVIPWKYKLTLDYSSLKIHAEYIKRKDETEVVGWCELLKYGNVFFGGGVSNKFLNSTIPA